VSLRVSGFCAALAGGGGGGADADFGGAGVEVIERPALLPSRGGGPQGRLSRPYACREGVFLGGKVIESP
jgi:hypothetical protein